MRGEGTGVQLCGADDRLLSSVLLATRQATKNDGLPHEGLATRQATKNDGLPHEGFATRQATKNDGLPHEGFATRQATKNDPALHGQVGLPNRALRMHLKMRVPGMLAALAVMLPGFAQQLETRPQVLKLSLKKAVEIALSPEGSTRLQLAQESLKQVESRKDQARAALLPDFEGQVTERNQTENLGALGLHIQLPPALGLNFPQFIQPFNVLDMRISANQNVFDFSTIRRFQAAKASLDAAKKDLDSTRDQVTEQAARAYLAAVRAQSAVETAKANMELSEALVKLATSQKNAGTGTGIEIARAKVQLANDRQNLLVAETQESRAKFQLLKVLGVRLENPVELTDRMEYMPEDPVDAEKALKTAIDSRPDWKAQREREQTAKLSYSSVKMERLPSVVGFADYGAIGSNVSQLPTREFGLSLRVPIFDGGRRDARRRESASQLRQEQVRTADLRDQIELEVRTAIDSLRSADAQVQAAREGLQLADEELAHARRRYEAGITSSIEITDAQTRIARARENVVSALYNHNLARIDVASAMGRIATVVR